MAQGELLSTMAQTTLGPGFSMVFEAIDQITGLVVSGVVINNATVSADTVDAEDQGPTVISVAPQFVPIPAAPDAPAADTTTATEG